MPAPPLLPHVVYHVYNRGVNRETLFRCDAHYRHFLRLLAHHLLPAAHVHAYALLPNHYHLILRPREDAERSASQALSNACNAYARAANPALGRVGALFSRPFQRKPVEGRAYAAALVRYVHENPQRHGLVSDFRAWPYTSWPVLSASRPTRLERAEVLAWHDAAPPSAVPEVLLDADFEADVHLHLNGADAHLSGALT